MITRKQYGQISSDIMTEEVIDDILNAIVDNLEPFDVYSETAIFDAAEAYTNDPSDIFDYDTLANWAYENGFVKEQHV